MLHMTNNNNKLWDSSFFISWQSKYFACNRRWKIPISTKCTNEFLLCLQMFCFVCGIIAHKLSQSDFDRPFSQDQLKTHREWMPLSSRLSKMYFSLLFVSKLFWLDFLQLLVTVYSNSSIPYWNSITVHSVKVVKTINIQIFEKEKLSVFKIFRGKKVVKLTKNLLGVKVGKMRFQKFILVFSEGDIREPYWIRKWKWHFH